MLGFFYAPTNKQIWMTPCRTLGDRKQDDMANIFLTRNLSRLISGLFACLLVLPDDGVFAIQESSTRPGKRKEAPNIVYIMADDMGYGDVKCFGREKSRAETPNLDRLAKSGIMFTDAHAPVAHCVPTRVAVMTGRYLFRFERQQKNAPWGFLYPRLPKGQPTLASVLKRRGYHSAYIGKWHLGLEMKTRDGKPQGPENVDYSKPVTFGPNDFGFDESFILPGSLDMFPYAFLRNQKWLGPVNARKGWSAFNRIGPAAEDFSDDKVLDRFSSEAESFIDKQDKSTRPFFLYLALTSPHTPISPSKKFRGKSKLGLYGDFLMETDDCVGRVLQALVRNGIRENTLVIFTSDHGAANYAGNIPKATVSQNLEMEKLGHYSNGPYRGHKFSIYEGGTRVPLIASWPGVTPKDTTCAELVGLNDMLATFADIAGAKLAESEGPDSFSFQHLLRDPISKSTRPFMICRSTNSFSIRKGDWKLALCPGSGCAGTWGNKPPRQEAWQKAVDQFGRRAKPNELRHPEFCQLFNLKSDPSESRNLAASEPQRLKELGAILDRINEEGRSTPGPVLKDARRFNLLADVPKFALEK